MRKIRCDNGMFSVRDDVLSSRPLAKNKHHYNLRCGTDSVGGLVSSWDKNLDFQIGPRFGIDREIWRHYSEGWHVLGIFYSKKMDLNLMFLIFLGPLIFFSIFNGSDRSITFLKIFVRYVICFFLSFWTIRENNAAFS